MKKIVLIVLLFVGIFSSAQNVSPQIKNSVLYFINSIKSKNIEQAVNCLYPKYFTVMTREQTATMLAFTYNNPMIKMEIKKLTFGKISPPQLIGKEYYSIVDYYLLLNLDVNSINDEMKNNIGKMLISKYGKSNVKLNDSKSTFIVNAPMKVCAISSDQKTWKLIFLEKELKSKLKNVFPEKIINQL